MIIKSVKVSEKGQIAIPADVRTEAGIKKGDSLILMESEGKILLEKPNDRLKDNFNDLLKHSELVAKKL